MQDLTQVALIGGEPDGLSLAAKAIGSRYRLSANAPLPFPALPAAVRLPTVRRPLFSAASGQMRKRFIGRLCLARLRAPRRGAFTENKLCNDELASFDDVVAATGYRVDIGLRDFLGGRLLAETASVDDVPARYEASVEGLFFVELVANFFGRLTRFAFPMVGKPRSGAASVKARLPAALAK